MAIVSGGKNNILIVVGAVIAIAAVGWFGWQYIGASKPEPAAQAGRKPAQSAVAQKAAPDKTAGAPARQAASPDKLIGDIMVVSGLKRTLDQLPEQILAGFKDAGKQGKVSSAEMREMEKIAMASFSAQGFNQQAVAHLKKNFDQKRFQAHLDDISTPLAKRMTALEAKQATPEELGAFARSLAAKPLSAERVSLIRKLDAAGRANALGAEVVFSSMKGMMRVFSGASPKQVAAADRAMARQRPAVEENIRNAVQVAMAYAYKDVSDADLAEYTRIYEKENNKWMLGLVYAAITEEFQNASALMGERLEKLARAKKGTQAADAAAGRPERSRANEDARACLDLENNKEIMKCAHRYR